MISGWLRFLALAGLVSIASVTHATHEADHRYRIYGTVENADGTPAVDTKVKLTGLGGRPIGETVTDKSGRYEFRMHVHNQDLGTRFWVSANGTVQEGKITFDPSDRETERMQRIDISAKE